MSKHQNDGTIITLELIKKRLERDDYGPEVVETIKYLVALVKNQENNKQEEIK